MKQYLVKFVTKKGGEENHEAITMARNAKEAIAIVKEIWYEREGNTMHAFCMQSTVIPDTEETTPTVENC